MTEFVRPGGGWLPTNPAGRAQLRSGTEALLAAHRIARGLNRLSDLESQVQRLPHRQKEFEVWKAIGEVMAGVSANGHVSDSAETRFNAVAEHHSFSLALGQWEDGLAAKRKAKSHASLIAHDAAGEALSALWMTVRGEFVGRLKTCAQCGRWFVDTSRNRSAKYCPKIWPGKIARRGASPRRPVNLLGDDVIERSRRELRGETRGDVGACVWKWWNRARRRKADHSQYRRSARSAHKRRR